MNDFLQNWQDGQKIPDWQRSKAVDGTEFLSCSIKVNDIQQAYDFAGIAIRIANNYGISAKLSINISKHGFGCLMYADHNKQISENDCSGAAEISGAIRIEAKKLLND